MIEDLTQIYTKEWSNKFDDDLISLFTLNGKLIWSFFDMKHLNPWACILTFKGYVNGLKDSSLPMSEQELWKMNQERTKIVFENLKKKWNNHILQK